VNTGNLEELRTRLDGIRTILMAHRDAGAALPSASKGVEREALVREFFARVFPPQFRFGSGAILDSAGARSGQLDIVVEFPFLPSFPTPGANERLYLADSASIAIEVKSDLTSQWGQVLAGAKQVIPLRRHWHAHGDVDVQGQSKTYEATASRIPFLAVGYRGPKTAAALKERLAHTDDTERPDALLVIESGAYSGCSLNKWSVSGEGAAGLLGFCTDAAWLVRNVTWAAPDIDPYIKAL
jgi:hypothetical protein